MFRRSRLTNEEKCHRKTKFYQGQFRDVPAISSKDYLEQRRTDAARSSKPAETILVDVRTPPERRVSMIEGAVSLQEFERDIVPSLQPGTQVITYCTIGYRSGMEARRLRNRYGLQGRIHSLDGIVSYTHAVEQARRSACEDASSATSICVSSPLPRVQDPATGTETMAVHTFGGMWGCVQQKYKATHFSVPILLVRLIQVSLVFLLRTEQRLMYNVKRYCVKRPKKE